MPAPGALCACASDVVARRESAAKLAATARTLSSEAIRDTDPSSQSEMRRASCGGVRMHVSRRLFCVCPALRAPPGWHTGLAFGGTHAEPAATRAIRRSAGRHAGRAQLAQRPVLLAYLAL